MVDITFYSVHAGRPSEWVWLTTIVTQVSAHECFNITSHFGPHGHLPGIKISYICIETATVPLEMQYIGACPETFLYILGSKHNAQNMLYTLCSFYSWDCMKNLDYIPRPSWEIFCTMLLYAAIIRIKTRRQSACSVYAYIGACGLSWLTRPPAMC